MARNILKRSASRSIIATIIAQTSLLNREFKGDAKVEKFVKVIEKQTDALQKHTDEVCCPALEEIEPPVPD